MCRKEPQSGSETANLRPACKTEPLAGFPVCSNYSPPGKSGSPFLNLFCTSHVVYVEHVPSSESLESGHVLGRGCLRDSPIKTLDSQAQASCSCRQHCICVVTSRC